MTAYGNQVHPRWERDPYEFCVEQDNRFQAAMRATLPRVVIGETRPAVINVVFNMQEPTPAPEARPGVPAMAWKRILAEVANKHALTVSQVTGRQRNRAFVIARHEAIYRLHTETEMSLPQIGRRVGGRDHTSVLHGIKRHKQRMAEADRG